MILNFKSRYNKLNEVVLCYPVNYSVENIDINRTLMFEQYNNFINTLAKENVIPYFLNPNYGTSQVYTRDIGFVIDDILFIGKMKELNRQYEYRALEEFIKDKNLNIKRLNNFIEGGDVILHDNIIFIGQSNRTSMEGILELQRVLSEENKDYKVLPIEFNKDEMLHLDCAFNVISNDSCVITDYLYNTDIFKETFDKCYYIENEEAKNLSANLLSLGNKKIISSSKNLCEMLSKDGINAIYIDYSEIIKGGGSFTCSTLPISSIWPHSIENLKRQR